MAATLETRKPLPLEHAGYATIVKAVPLLRGYCLFVDATNAHETSRQHLTVPMDDAAHWIPTDVFEGLNGVQMDSGGKLYTCEAEAMADLTAVWEETDGRNADS